MIISLAIYNHTRRQAILIASNFFNRQFFWRNRFIVWLIFWQKAQNIIYFICMHINWFTGFYIFKIISWKPHWSFIVTIPPQFVWCSNFSWISTFWINSIFTIFIRSIISIRTSYANITLPHFRIRITATRSIIIIVWI